MTTAIVSRVGRPFLDRMGRLVGIPLAVALTSLFQLDFSVVEGEYPRSLLGAPLPWHALSIATAPDSQVFAVPLIADFLVYSAVSVLIVRFWRKSALFENEALNIIAASLTWFAGLYGLARISGYVLLDGQVQPWYDSFATALKSISLPFAH